MNVDDELAIAEAAAPGPWTWGWRDDADAPGSVFRWEHYHDNDDGTRSGSARALAMCPRYGSDAWEADATFIAHARTAVPAALAVVKAAQETRRVVEDGDRTDSDAAWEALYAALDAFEKATQ